MKEPQEDIMDVGNDDTRELILVSAYDDLSSARDDFDELARQVKQERFRVREAILLGKDLDGMPAVHETSSGHHGRAGAAMGVGVGVLVGLLIPPVPAAMAVGAAAGALVASFADHNLKLGLRHDIAETLAAGTGVVIVLVSSYNELWARRALSRAASHVVVPFAESTIASLEQIVADATRVAD